MRYKVISIVICFAVMIIIAIIVVNIKTSNDSKKDLIVTALRAQDALGGQSLEVIFDYGSQKEGSEVAHYRYVKTPELLFVSNSLPDFEEREAFDRNLSEDKLLYISRRNNRKTGVISRDVEGPLSLQSVMETGRLRLKEGLLMDIIARGYVSDEMENVDGSNCYRINTEFKNARNIRKYTIWVDEKIGFCPRRIELQTRNNYNRITQFTDYRDLGGGYWFPGVITHSETTRDPQLVSHVAPGVDGPMQLVNIATIKSIALKKNIDTSTLKVAFPSGTEVQDSIRHKSYRIP
ncbi:MAG: hypothetical protein ACYC27_21680 [Armatimonadota bacterium]